uniref:DNA polymerase delta 4, accessory subunit n=1 Tax=Sphenodon punctatus TaxID=8508 RepID=A0A8D0GZJ6_SPHPU
MGRKRLITDSFQVVKTRKEGDGEIKEAQRSKPGSVQVKSTLGDTARPDQLEMLKQFDLSWEYGPCTGITRLQRWERAQLLGLNPPLTVREMLLQHEGNASFMYSLWHEYPL